MKMAEHLLRHSLSIQTTNPNATNQLYLYILEIQFLAYLHNAEDQLRGEAATLAFFSDGHFTNPMILFLCLTACSKFGL